MTMHSHFLKIVLLFVFVATISVVDSKSLYAQTSGFDAPGSRSSNVGAVGLVPVEDQVDGGSIPISATGQVVVVFRNEGAQPVQTGQINLYPSSTVSASVTLNQCAQEPLLSGAECAVAVSVKGLQSGPWRVELLMLHDGRSRLVTTTLSGSIDSSGDSSSGLSSDIETIPDEVDFGSLATSQTMIESVVFRNVTSNPIDVSDVYINAADSAGYTIDHDCNHLEAGQACIATVKWAPKQKGPSTGVVILRHSGPAGLAKVSLNGDYDPDEIEEAEIFPEAVPGRGLLVSSQTEVDFGTAISSASTITVSLVNVGDSPLALKGIKIAGTDNGLSLSEYGCSPEMVLQPIEACTLTITWSPTRIGALLDDVQVLHDGARGILVLPVRGEANATVSQDQGAIVLTSSAPTRVIGSDDVTTEDRVSAPNKTSTRVANASSALDGLKITSFAKTRAIVNGPGGSRLLYNAEPVMLGGIMWDVDIQDNGIEFANGGDRILLLFDRSLSSVSRVSGDTSSSSQE